MVNSNKYRNISRTQGDIEMGKFLAQWRLIRGLTQQQMADKLSGLAGVRWTQVRVTNYETGRTPLTLSNFMQVCHVLDLHAGLTLANKRAISPKWFTQRPALEPSTAPNQVT